MISKRVPRPSASISGSGFSPKVAKKLAGPENGSSTPVHAGRDHHRGGDAVARAHAAEVERLLDMLAVAIPERDAGRLLRRIGEHVPHLTRRQSRAAPRPPPPRRNCRPRLCVLCVAVSGTAIAERHVAARADVVAERHGAERSRAAAVAKSRRPRAPPARWRSRDGSGRPDASRRSRRRGRPCRWRAPPARPAPAAPCPKPSLRRHRLQRLTYCAACRPRRQARARNDGRERIEDMMAGFRADLFRQWRARGRGNVIGDCRGERARLCHLSGHALSRLPFSWRPAKDFIQCGMTDGRNIARP